MDARQGVYGAHSCNRGGRNIEPVMSASRWLSLHKSQTQYLDSYYMHVGTEYERVACTVRPLMTKSVFQNQFVFPLELPLNIRKTVLINLSACVFPMHV